MKQHFDLDDNTFEQQFENCSLPDALFSHEAHLRLAWIHLEKYGLEQAIKNVVHQLKNYTKSLGAASKYNETVTVAALYVVNHFKLKSATNNFADFIKENIRLNTHFKELLGQHYLTDIFNTEEAKLSFLQPELLPFE